MKIQRLGKYERYVVLNDDERYWSGPLGWVPELRQARVFAEREKAEKVVRVLSQQLRDIENGTKFIAQAVVTTSSWLPPEELREALGRHVCLLNEIESDLLVFDVEIDWDSLRQQDDD